MRENLYKSRDTRSVARHRHLLVEAPFHAPPTIIRPATEADWAEITRLRDLYFASMGRPIAERTSTECEWYVGERKGRVTCCVSWRDYESARVLFDFYRAPGLGALVDCIRLGRWATLRADADGVEPVFAADVRNVAHRRALLMTEQWEEAGPFDEGASVLYRRKR